MSFFFVEIITFLSRTSRLANLLNIVWVCVFILSQSTNVLEYLFCVTQLCKINIRRGIFKEALLLHTASIHILDRIITPQNCYLSHRIVSTRYLPTMLNKLRKSYRYIKIASPIPSLECNNPSKVRPLSALVVIWNIMYCVGWTRVFPKEQLLITKYKSPATSHRYGPFPALFLYTIFN